MIRPSTNANDTRPILPVFRVSRFTVQDMAASTEEGGDGTGPNGGGGGGNVSSQATNGGGYILTSTGIMYTGGKRERDGGDTPIGGNADAEQQHKLLAKQLHLQQQNEVMKNRLVKLKKRVEASAGARPVRSAEAVIVMHDHGHPHVLMLRYHTTVMVPQNRGENNNMNIRGGPMRNMRVGQVSIPAVSYTYRLPGGTCRENESEVPCLLRKLGRRLLGYTKEPKNSHLPTGNSEFEEVSAAGNHGGGGGEQAGLQAGVRVPIHDGGGVSIVTQAAPAAVAAHNGQADGISGRLSFATPKKMHPTTTTTSAAAAALPSTPPQRPSIVVPEEKPADGDGELQFSLGDSMPSPSSQHVSSPHKPPRGSVGGGGVASTPLGSQIFSAAAATPNNTSASSPSAFAASNAMMATTTTTVQPHVTIYSAAAKGAAECFKISQVVGTWFRPAYDKPMYPYCPAHIVKEKESRLLYLVGVEDVEELRFIVNPDAAPQISIEGQEVSVGNNNNNNNRTGASAQQGQRVLGKGVTSQGTLYDLVAVPLFDLYNNAAKYGTIAESLPHILSRFNMEYNE